MVGLRSRVALWVMTAVLTTAGTVTAVNALAADRSSSDSLSADHAPVPFRSMPASPDPVPSGTSSGPPVVVVPPTGGSSTPTRQPATGSATGSGGRSVDIQKAPEDAQTIQTDGGVIVAACSGDKVTLYSWTPAPGYHVSSPEPGPALSAGVKFATSGSELRISVTCENGRAKARVTQSR